MKRGSRPTRPEPTPACFTSLLPKREGYGEAGRGVLSAASDPVDAVIIGTRAGGAPLLARLAQAGLSVVALEAGTFWDPTCDFAKAEPRSRESVPRTRRWVLHAAGGACMAIRTIFRGQIMKIVPLGWPCRRFCFRQWGLSHTHCVLPFRCGLLGMRGSPPADLKPLQILCRGKRMGRPAAIPHGLPRRPQFPVQ